MQPVNLGWIPTPALADYGWSRGRAGIMVTGSHIPFDRNGYKLNTPCRELLKSDEGPIGEFVAKTRARIYAEDFTKSPFSEAGDFKEILPLPPEDTSAAGSYFERYTTIFSPNLRFGARASPCISIRR